MHLPPTPSLAAGDLSEPVSTPAPVTPPEPLRPAAGVVFRSAKAHNRFELKYLVPAAAVPGLVAEMRGYAAPDQNATGDWGYRVYSVYWDSADLRCFWEKVEGVKFRRKLRVRRYGDSRNVYVEIKQRIDRTLQKRRVLRPLERLPALFEDDAGDLAPGDSGAVEGEIACFRRAHALRPRMAISYRRRAFFAAFERDVRITFDTRVQYSASALDIGAPFESGRYVVDPRLAIMEIKFGERVPRWLRTLVCRHGLEITRLSKYCTAVDLEYYGGQVTPLL